MAKNKNMATDIIDVVREGTKRWTRTKEIRGTPPRHDPLSNVTDDQRATNVAEGRRVGDHGRGLP